MRISHGVWAVLLIVAAVPGAAAWRTENEAVRVAARDPRIAEALRAMDAIDAAVLARDEAAFTRALAPDLAVNNPGNMSHVSAMTAKTFAAGRIDYSSYDRLLDHVALRPSGEVVAMGWEIVTPRGKAANAGKTVRRRFTDVWRKDGATRRLALRQATIVDIK